MKLMNNKKSLTWSFESDFFDKMSHEKRSVDGKFCGAYLKIDNDENWF